MALANKTEAKLGRLNSLGVEELHQVALLLPEKYLDLRQVVNSQQELQPYLNAIFQSDSNSDPSITFVGWIDKMPKINNQPNRQPMAKFTLFLSDGFPVRFTLFGSKEEIESKVEEYLERRKPIALNGFPVLMGNSIWVNGNTLFDIDNAGKMMPVYQGKARVIKPETVRAAVAKHLYHSIPAAAEYIRNKIPGEDMAKVFEQSKLEMVLEAAHYPKNPAVAERANQILDTLAAMYSLNKIKEHVRPKFITGKSARLDLTRWMQYTGNLEFELTDEQYAIINEIAFDINQGIPLRGMLMGDVGSGKTIIYGLLAIACVLDENKDAFVLLPNTTLANQIYSEIHALLPDSEKDRIALVTSSKETVRLTTSKKRKSMIRVGTTSLLFKEFDFTPGMVITDEQQKFSDKQRRQLLSNTTHLLEVSATPIPRSVALVKYGALRVWRLTKNHTKKTIHSHLLVGKEDGKVMMKDVQNKIKSGHQAIIVYALKDDSESKILSGMVSAEEAYHKWDKKYPGRVRLVHSNMDDETKSAAIQDMKEQNADILISTTVIEVGVTIPNAMLLAVINAERFGLVSLWQLRGRLARRGGQGDFYMLLPKENNSKKTLERLNVMLDAKDGFEVAERDLKLRGAGDLALSSETQSGVDNSILVGRKINLDILNKMIEENNKP